MCRQPEEGSGCAHSIALHLISLRQGFLLTLGLVRCSASPRDPPVSALCSNRIAVVTLFQISHGCWSFQLRSSQVLAISPATEGRKFKYRKMDAGEGHSRKESWHKEVAQGKLSKTSGYGGFQLESCGHWCREGSVQWKRLVLVLGRG